MTTRWIKRAAQGALGAVGLLVLLPAVAHAQGLADLGVVKSVDKTEAVVGEEVTYTLVISNAGPDGTAARLIDTLPALAEVVSPLPNGCSQSGFVLTCTGQLNAGASRTMTVVVVPTAPGIMLNSASILPQDLLVLDPNPLNNLDAVTTTVTPGGGTTSPPPTSPPPTPSPSASETQGSPSPIDSATPVGGVDTGAGGSASSALGPALIATGLVAGLIGLLFVRRRLRS